MYPINCDRLFSSKYFLLSFISPLNHWLFKNMLFNFYVFMNFPNFLLLFVSNLISLWSLNILGMLLIILNLFRLVLSPNIWSVLEECSTCAWKDVRILQWLNGVCCSDLLYSRWFFSIFVCYWEWGGLWFIRRKTKVFLILNNLSMHHEI